MRALTLVVGLLSLVVWLSGQTLGAAAATRSDPACLSLLALTALKGNADKIDRAFAIYRPNVATRSAALQSLPIAVRRYRSWASNYRALVRRANDGYPSRGQTVVTVGVERACPNSSDPRRREQLLREAVCAVPIGTTQWILQPSPPGGPCLELSRQGIHGLRGTRECDLLGPHHKGSTRLAPNDPVRREYRHRLLKSLSDGAKELRRVGLARVTKPARRDRKPWNYHLCEDLTARMPS